ncbi:MAG: hypothetical protein ABWY78_06260 [Microvirga sp.]
MADLPYRRHRIAGTLAAGPLEEEIDDIYRWLKAAIARLDELEGDGTGGGGGGGGGTHELLSSTHTDTTPASEIDGDLIAGQGGAWARLPIGTAADVLTVVAGQPTWTPPAAGGITVTGPTILGRNDVGLGAMEELTPTEATAMLDVMEGDAGAGGIKGLVPDQGAGDASGGKFLKADGTWDVPPGIMVDHPLLDGDQNNDTIAASPVAGDVVYAEAGSAGEGFDETYFGGSVMGLVLLGDPGGGDYWAGGSPIAPAAGDSTTVRWVRKPLSDLVDIEGVASVGASVYRTTDFAFAAATPTTVTWEAVAFDDAVFWSAGSPTRLTVPTGKGGTYVISASANWASALTTATTFIAIYVNGVLTRRTITGITNLAAEADGIFTLTDIQRLNAGDYVTLVLEHKGIPGATHTVHGGATLTNLKMIKV